MPDGALQPIEMSIKLVWVNEYKRHAYVITAINPYTRVVLGWKDTC